MKQTHIITAALLALLSFSATATADEDSPEFRAGKRAIRSGSEAQLQQVIAGGVSVNTTDDDGETFLMEAVERGSVSMVRALLTAGADVNAADDDGETALDHAREERRDNIVRILEAAGAR